MLLVNKKNMSAKLNKLSFNNIKNVIGRPTNVATYTKHGNNIVYDRKNKIAYPNIATLYTRPRNIDIEKWKKIAIQVFEQAHDGISIDVAIKSAISNWDKDEAIAFKRWLEYYKEKVPEKYNVKTSNNKNIIKVAFGDMPEFLPEWENPNMRKQTFNANDGKTKKEIEIDRAKQFKAKMKGRMRSLKILLDKYNDLLPHQNVDKLYDEMVALDKSIGKLNAYASLQDRVLCSANRMEKFGFNAGAQFLKASVAAQNESVSDNSDTNLPPGTLKSSIEEVITRMEAVSKSLKMREAVRDLSRIDIMLSELGMGSYFPEITDALSKLIEGFSYSSNRIEGVIAKLRGSGKPAKSDSAPIATPPVPNKTIIPTAPVVPQSIEKITSQEGEKPRPIVLPATENKMDTGELHSLPSKQQAQQLL